MPFKHTSSPTTTSPSMTTTSKRKTITTDELDYSDTSNDELADTDDHYKKKRFRKQQAVEEPIVSTPKAEDSDHDATGELKVDKYGNLNGGRQYRVPTFTLPQRDDATLFMFSKDPAALLGFRDSFVFLKKNKKLQKVHISNEEKSYLVDENLLRSTFRTREISVVTARSVFKQFGHRIVKKGKKGRDDYYFTEDELEEESEMEEDYHHHEDNNNNSNNNKRETHESSINDMMGDNELSLPNRLAGGGGGGLRKGRHAGSGGGGNNNVSSNLIPPSNFQYNGSINHVNWIHYAAVSTRQFNTSLFMHRRNNPVNYDLLTNVYQIQRNMQTLKND